MIPIKLCSESRPKIYKLNWLFASAEIVINDFSHKRRVMQS